MARILLADDDDILVDLVRFRLEAAGHDLIVATDGGAALACARAEQPDAIILDAMMPVMSGEDFLRHLRENPSFGPIPVIIVTASGRQPLPGAQGILKKPFEIGDLFATVAAHCV